MATILGLMGVSVFINYIDRGSLSTAAPMLKGEFGLSASQLGVLLSAFFMTYACFQVVSGWLVDHFDVKWVMAAGFFLWSAATAVTGMVNGFVLLLIARLVLGAGESVAYPSYSRYWRLFPRGTARLRQFRNCRGAGRRAGVRHVRRWHANGDVRLAMVLSGHGNAEHVLALALVSVDAAQPQY